MSELMVLAGALTMSSREIAELTGKQHAHVMRDIRVMLDAFEQNPDLDFVCKSTFYVGENGQSYPQYELDKNTCLTLLLGYDPVARMKVVVRWQELEAAQTPATPILPKNYAAALRALADQHEQLMLVEQQRDVAVATKAEIGSRREATAMNKASKAVKRANQLEIELDQSMEYATIKRMELLYHGQKFNWRRLKSASADIGIPPEDVFDANYGTVKAYHAEAWREAYALDIPGGEVA